MWYYKQNDDNSARFLLGEKGENMLVCIGINPSSATPTLLDFTTRRVKALSKIHGFDGWAIINLYPERCLSPDKLSKECNQRIIEQNIEEIKRFFNNNNILSVWAAWGNSIEKSEYLKACLKEISEVLLNNGVEFVHLGNLTKSGHPKHPRISTNKENFYEFDIVNYIKRCEL